MDDTADHREPWRERQAALADFSLEALRSTDLDGILQQACAFVARGLNVPIAKAMQMLPGEQNLLIRGQFGLPPDLARVGETKVPGGSGSAAGYALETAEPVICDVATETRFEVSEIVRRSGVRVSANVLIPSDSGPFGVLEVDSRSGRQFSQEDIDFLRIYATLIGAAVNRIRSGLQLQTLLRELQHRVKNDLQVVTALLTLESREAESLEARARLGSIASRVNSLRLVHDRLYASSRTDRVDLADYLRTLCEDRLRLHGLESRGEIALDLRLEPEVASHDQAVALGLIVNEFLTNSFKYAFPMGRGLISVVLARPEPGAMKLTLADNGIGIKNEDSARGRGSGRRLIGMMADQIGATATWSSNDGTQLTLILASRC